MSVDNGRTLTLSFGEFTGQVGMATRGKTARVSYFATSPAKSMIGQTVSIDDADWLVTNAARSQYVSGMCVLDLLKGD